MDPDGLLGDRDEIVRSKLAVENGLLPNPQQIEGHSDLSHLPPLSIFDIYNYFTLHQDYHHKDFREYHKMEGYTMAQDGFVKSVQVVEYTNFQSFCAVKAKVKPRTRATDPLTGKGFYALWIIFSRLATLSSVYSAYCICEGGIDGGCRHVAATLFDIMECLNDFSKSSTTSQTCMWNHRSSGKIIGEDPSVDLMETSIRDSSQETHVKPSEQKAIANKVDLPCLDTFMRGLKEIHPDSVLLDTKFKRDSNKPFITPSLNITTPMQRLELFCKYHDSEHTCNQNCFDELFSIISYSDKEINAIEIGTRGQSKNANWLAMRHGLWQHQTLNPSAVIRMGLKKP